MLIRNIQSNLFQANIYSGDMDIAIDRWLLIDELMHELSAILYSSIKQPSV